MLTARPAIDAGGNPSKNSKSSTGGSRDVRREIEHFTVDVIISVSYRVNQRAGDAVLHRSHPDPDQWRLWMGCRLASSVASPALGYRRRLDMLPSNMGSQLPIVGSYYPR
jgi:hypothetical protein